MSKDKESPKPEPTNLSEALAMGQSLAWQDAVEKGWSASRQQFGLDVAKLRAKGRHIGTLKHGARIYYMEFASELFPPK